jgi:hypothetical protein
MHHAAPRNCFQAIVQACVPMLSERSQQLQLQAGPQGLWAPVQLFGMQQDRTCLRVITSLATFRFSEASAQHRALACFKALRKTSRSPSRGLFHFHSAKLVADIQLARLWLCFKIGP